MKGRPALALPPTYGTVAASQDAYVDSMMLRRIARQSGRYWSFHAAPTTAAMSGNRYAKSLSPFTSHTDEASFQELLREYASHNVPRPGGYADVFHEYFQSPRVPYSVNALLAPCMAGGWQEAIQPGRHYDTYYKYDMRSAYLWAATLGMPDTRTYTRSLEPWKNRECDGLYRVKLLEPTAGAPFPFNFSRECLATGLEIETYNLRIAEVVDGVVWKRTTAADAILSAIRKVSTWKQAGRAYWGRWGQLQKVTCTAKGKSWQLPNLALNVPWAHLIISRVKMRLWECSKDAVHVFVDSVITPRRLPVGDDLGDWRLEKIYENGVIIRGPGQYGALDAPTFDRMAGVAMFSDRRNTPVAQSVVPLF